MVRVMRLMMCSAVMGGERAGGGGFEVLGLPYDPDLSDEREGAPGARWLGWPR